MCRSQQHVLLLCVCAGFAMVRVTQVVHRVHERLVVHLQFLHHVGENFGAIGIETEMDLEHVEPLVIVADPTRFEHQRRPPAARHGPTVRCHRIVKAHNGTAPIGLGQVSNVDVRGGHRGDAQRQAPTDWSSGLLAWAVHNLGAWAGCASGSRAAASPGIGGCCGPVIPVGRRLIQRVGQPHGYPK